MNRTSSIFGFLARMFSGALRPALVIASILMGFPIHATAQSWDYSQSSSPLPLPSAIANGWFLVW